MALKLDATIKWLQLTTGKRPHRGIKFRFLNFGIEFYSMELSSIDYSSPFFRHHLLSTWYNFHHMHLRLYISRYAVADLISKSSLQTV